MSQPSNERIIISHLNPKSPVSEAYRMLRTNIQFSSIDTEIKTIMVTSAGPGEGKSTTASNLAVTYAQAEEKVLIIDADLRKPTIHRVFQQTNRLGLTTVLTNQSSIQDVIRETEIPNVHLITSLIPPNPSELLSSKRMLSLIEELKQHYTKIIIDTPPILIITDAQIVSTWCDGVVLVIDSEKVKKEMALKAKESLQKVNANILGVTLNNVSQKNNDSYYYYYYYGQDQK